MKLNDNFSVSYLLTRERGGYKFLQYKPSKIFKYNQRL